MEDMKIARRPSRRMDAFLVVAGLLSTALPLEAALEKEFVWESFGHKETLKVRLPAELETHYSSKPRHYRYGSYITEDPGFELSAKLATAFQDRAKEEHLGEWEMVNMVVDFVQSLEYQSEVGEYPKYPVETLMDGGGDCEDTSILLAAILDKLGVDCIMLSPPGHMAVGVAVEALDAKHYPYNGRSYYYVETTGTNWKIGAIPPTYTGVAKIFALPASTQTRKVVIADMEIDGNFADEASLTNIMVAFYRAAIGEEDARKQPLYRYQVRIEAEEDLLTEIKEVQYRFMGVNGEIDPNIPWMRSYEPDEGFFKEWIAAEYRPMQVRIFFGDGSLVETLVNFAPKALSD